MEKLLRTLKSKFGYDPSSTPKLALSSGSGNINQQKNFGNPSNNLGSLTTHLGSQVNQSTSMSTADHESFSKFHLYNHWVLDGGSDVHICNDEAAHNFQRTEESTQNNQIISGTTKYAVEAWGTCKISIERNAS